jgi:acyl carrier protein
MVVAMAPCSPDPILGSMSLVEDLGYDSLGLIELAFAVTQAFALPAMSEEDSRNVTTIADVEELVVRLSSPSPEAGERSAPIKNEL